MKNMLPKIKKGLPVAFLVIIILTIGMFWYDQINYYLHHSFDYEEINCRKEDSVALIKVQGEIVSYDSWHSSEEGYEYDTASSESIVGYIEDAEERDHIKAIIIEIDSYGGLPVASEEIMNAIKRANKPTVAVIRGSGVSGGYLIATGADYIFASEMSDVGGMGITMSYLDYSEQKRRDGIIYQELSSGKFKDTGSQDKNLTEEEKELLMRDIIELHDIFVRKIAENRGLEVKEVERLADGSSMLGERAKDNGLIDEIGDIYSAKEWISKKLSIYPEICVY
jgi:protease IV